MKLKFADSLLLSIPLDDDWLNLSDMHAADCRGISRGTIFMGRIGFGPGARHGVFMKTKKRIVCLNHASCYPLDTIIYGYREVNAELRVWEKDMNPPSVKVNRKSAIANRK